MSFEEKVKSSFERVKDEISLIRYEVQNLKNELSELKVLKEELKALKEEFSTRNQPLIKTNFIPSFSIGNEGVPANQQTNTSTVNTPPFPVDDNSYVDSSTPTHFPADNPAHLQHIPEKVQQTNTKLDKRSPLTLQKSYEKDEIGEMNNLTEIIEGLKTDLKKKFKTLTRQEFHIFSMLYTLDKSQNSITYQDLAVRTGLTSSSIRDYIQRIIKKGIPIVKEKQNNKLVTLKIPQELKNLATLDSLIRLRKDFSDESLDNFTKE